MTRSLAESLAEFVASYQPSDSDLRLAQRSLVDTLSVTLAGLSHPIRTVVRDESDAVRFAALGHVLDFDDLHLASTTHASVVCVSATLAVGGDARAYLSGAGVMARIGTALGWSHYSSGWHATCTAGAPAAAVAASVALGLSPSKMAHAIALSLSCAGGVQRAFGTDAKSIQVGLAVDAGVRAARLAARGARGGLDAVEQWLALLRADDPERLSAPDLDKEIIPGGLAVKVFPCCYALQRPIVSASMLRDAGVELGELTNICVRTPASAVLPLIHHRPQTGLEGKFSLEYGIAAGLLDRYPGFQSFEDRSVVRSEAQRLVELVTVELEEGGDSLLSGDCEVEVELRDGARHSRSVSSPPGAPEGEFVPEFFDRKLAECGATPGLIDSLTWENAAELLRGELVSSRNR